jgi:aminopeptidase
MSDPRMENWAAALVHYSVDVKAGQTVAILGTTAAEPLLRAVYRAVLRAGAYPTLMVSLPGVQADYFALASDEQLQTVSPVERFHRETADVTISIMADTNTRGMSEIDPSRQQLHQKARAGLMKSFLERSAAGTLDWTLTLYPTDAFAQDAGMSTDAFAAFVQRACKLDVADPVAAWQAQGARQQRLIDWLAGKQEIHLVGDGTDLRVGIGGRTWINDDGRKNFPGGEIFTGPVESAVDGHVRFSFPVVTAGREIEDIRLRFEAGRVVDASAARNEAYLLKVLDTDEGARRLGEFAFGTNFGIDRFIRNILFDEKIGGTVHMAVGAGYPETGSQNQSAVHWDMICDLRQGGVVTIDGVVFFEQGRYVVD